jgi:hypothetical protein
MEKKKSRVREIVGGGLRVSPLVLLFQMGLGNEGEDW